MADTDAGTTLAFKAGQPVLAKLSAERIIPSGDAPRGAAQISVAISLNHEANSDKAVCKVEVEVAGISTENKDLRVFEISCAFEYPISFSRKPKESELKDKNLIMAIGEPLYVMSISEAQNTAWRMGYMAVKLPHKMSALPMAATQKTKAPAKRSAGTRKTVSLEQN